MELTWSLIVAPVALWLVAALLFGTSEGDDVHLDDSDGGD
jgi:hypothetical protein